jgi:hypothetical protein
VHTPIEIGVELGNQLLLLWAITLATDGGFEAGSPKDEGLVPTGTRIVAGAQLFVKHLDTDLRGKDLTQCYFGGGDENLKG